MNSMATSNGLVFALCLALVVAMAAATQFRVGGSAGWTVPGNPDAMPYNRWAQRSRFKIGDSLLFVYQAGSDSVLQVSKEAYDTCNVSAPVGRYDGGNTVFALDRSGPFHFISGVEKNCLKNEKLVVVVLADRSNRVSTATPPPTSPSSSPQSSSPAPSPQSTTLTPSSSSPSPQPTTAPSPPPTSSSSPPPTPSSSSPPTPASSSPSEITPSASSSPSEITPSPTPSPPTNGASFNVVGFMGMVGALLGSALVI